MSVFSIVFITILVFGSEGLKLPDYITPCSRTDPNFNQCALEQGRAAIPKIANGDPEYGVPNLNPFYLKEMTVNDFGMSFGMRETTVAGIQNAYLEDIQIDLDKLTINLKFQVPQIIFIGKYEMSGKMANLPLAGKGEFNATIGDVTVTFKAVCTTITKSDGIKYLLPLTHDLNLDPKIGKVYFANLFNGNKFLGDVMNTFMNENFQLIARELGKPAYKGFGIVVHQILTAITDKVPYDEMFAK